MHAGLTSLSTAGPRGQLKLQFLPFIVARVGIPEGMNGCFLLGGAFIGLLDVSSSSL